MPEIKVKHVVSFSSEDKVHKAENLLKAETYRKWKCAVPGEKNATIVLQFEKATKIHSIDIGNEGSAFVEVLVGRSSDSVSNYQVLLVASSFMSPLESRNGTHANRVRMFGPEKLSQNTKDEKWDCVQVVCTQPFNKNLQYGLTFIKFHSPPEKVKEDSNSTVDGKTITKLGAFKLRVDEDDDDSLPSIDSVFKKQRMKASENVSGPTDDQAAPSYAAVVLASNSNALKVTSQDNSLKRKVEEKMNASQEPPAKKTSLDKEHIVYKDVLRSTPESKKMSDINKNVRKDSSSPKVGEKKKEPSLASTLSKKVAANNTPVRPSRQKMPFNKIMDRVVLVLSGFVNPLRSELREKALEMGAKYKPDWDDSCTHLVCAFAKTPKYEQVKKVNGRIVSKEWILDCYRKKEPLLWRKYDMSGVDSSDEQDDSDKDPDYNHKAAAVDDDDSDNDPDYGDEYDEKESDEFIVEDSDEDKNKKKKKKPQTKFQRSKNRAANSPIKKKAHSPVAKNQTVKNNALSTRIKLNISDVEDESNSQINEADSSMFIKIMKYSHKNDTTDNAQSSTLLNAKDESETEDEEALQDYIANTDVEDDSGGDTEDEIRKVEARTSKKNVKMNGVNMEITEKPDISELPLPELPDFFKKRHFFLYGDFPPSKFNELRRYITAYNGILEGYVNDKVKYVVTEMKWDKDFDDALSENEDLIFVKPSWIYKCHENGKLVPFQPYIVIPDT